METRILDLREAHPRWGGRKLARRLIDLGVTDVPRASTVTEVLRRHDKLDPTETARRLAPVRFEREAPNEMWQMDFKGHFALDRGRCHALTVLDDHSRYLIGLSACANETRETVQARLIDLFRRHGLPERLLCDNGSPWGASGADSFTELEVWLLRCGVRMRHGRPYHSQTQGKDERFHRTLDVEVCRLGASPTSRPASPPSISSAGSTTMAASAWKDDGSNCRRPSRAWMSPFATRRSMACGMCSSCASGSRKLTSATRTRTVHVSGGSPNTCQGRLRSEQCESGVGATGIR